MIISKGESLWVPKGVDMKFIRITGSAFDQDI